MTALRSSLQATCWLAALWVAVVTNSATAATDGSFDYHSPDHGYSLIVPAGWVQIPRDVVQSRGEKMVPGRFAGKGSVDAAFQPADHKDWFSLPSIVVIVVPYTNLGLTGPMTDALMQQVSLTVNSADLTKAIVRNSNPTTQARWSAMNLGPPRISFTDGELTFYTAVTSKRSGGARGEVVTLFGRDALVEIGITSAPSDWNRNARLGWSVIESFQFDRAHTRDRFGTLQGAPPAHTFDAIDAVLIGAGILGSVTLGITIVAWLQYRRRASAATAPPALRS